jgi:biopolymer transport protein ExbD
MRFTNHFLLVLAAAALWACGDSKGMQVVRIDVSASGDYSLNGSAVAKGNLAAKLTELDASRTILHIAADHLANHQSVVGVLDAAKVAGIRRISFVHDQASTK